MTSLRDGATAPTATIDPPWGGAAQDAKGSVSQVPVKPVVAEQMTGTPDEICQRIKQAVAEHMGVKQIEFVSPRRTRAIARPRQVAMYLVRGLTALSYPQIGKRFGNRDHTTVMYAIRKINELRTPGSEFINDFLARICTDLKVNVPDVQAA
jgi:chromosomal replication initiation ATPase DnaA